jgi:DNA polymerase-4
MSENLPIGELRGVGPSTERVLRSFGLQTVGQLSRFPPKFCGDDLENGRNCSYNRRAGEGDDTVLMPHERPLEKSMGHEHTLSRGMRAGNELFGELHKLCAKTARRLRAGKLAGRVVTVKLRYTSFVTLTHAFTLPRYIQHGSTFIRQRYICSPVLRFTAEVRLIGVPSDLVLSADSSAGSVVNRNARTN